MPTTFEELADNGPYGGEPKFEGKKQNSPVLFFTVLIVLFLIAGGAFAYFSFFRKVDPKVTEAAEILLSVDQEVIHTRDDATEFDLSFYSLKKRVREPEYRDTQAAEKVVRLVGVEPDLVDIRERDLETKELVSNSSGEDEASKAEVGAFKENAEEEDAKFHKLIVVDRNGLVDSSQLPEVTFNRDWGGIILVPDGIALSKAYTSGVRLMRIEAHPLKGERLRVWARIQNISGEPLETEVGCEFRSEQSTLQGARFVPTSIPDGASIDVYFDSPQDRVESYTVLVKRTG